MPAAWCAMARGFFTSMGFAPLPKTFWERSLFTKPPTVTWSATPAHGISTTKTTCVSRCASRFATKISLPFTTNSATTFYQRAYKNQPFFFKNGANDGFHEAIGDTIALAITPEYCTRSACSNRFPKAE